jgi:hypothetical protein
LTCRSGICLSICRESGFWRVGLCLFATSGCVSGSHFKMMSRHNRLAWIGSTSPRPISRKPS